MPRRAAAILFRLALVLFACATLPRPAMAAPAAESFVSDNIKAALAILDDRQLAAPQRKAHFQSFLLGITDIKRVARFTLGKYAASASPAQQDAFAAAFQNYIVAVYQSYFMRYSGQTLAILRTTQHAPGDFVVATTMTSPEDRSVQHPLEVDFRVRTDGATPVIVDIGVAGVWLALAEQADFVAVLNSNGGDIPALIGHLNDAAAKF